MAQLGARFHGMEEVIGSIPIRSTIHPRTIYVESFLMRGAALLVPEICRRQRNRQEFRMVN